MSELLNLDELAHILLHVATGARQRVTAPSIDQPLPIQLSQADAASWPAKLLDAGRRLGDMTTDQLLDRHGWPGELVHQGTVPAERGAEFHADLLAATWLGLYFLGVPFNEPWERARRLIESAGGYPHGACINKGIGDVYRWARRKLEREYGVTKGADPSAPERLAGSPADAAPAPASTHDAPGTPASVPQYGVVVYTRLPLALLPLDQWSPPRTVTTREIASLGRCYALLQLRLYAASGLPFAYIVPRDVVAEALQRNPDARVVAQWIVQTLGHAARPGQGFLVSERNPASDGMPTCILAPTRGLTTLEGLPPNGHEYGISFAGHRIGSALTESYRIRMRQFSVSRLAWTDADSLTGLLRRYAAQEPRATRIT